MPIAAETEAEAAADVRNLKRFPARFLARVLPNTLLGRLSVVMVLGVIVTQLAGGLIWAAHLRTKSQQDTRIASQHAAHSAQSAIRYFMSLPANYRPIMIQQLREMGGTRFFVNANSQAIPVHPIAANSLADIATATISQTLKDDLPFLPEFRLAFAWPDELVVSGDGSKVVDLPDKWVQYILLTQPNPAPVLVIQTQIEPDQWLYL